MTRCLVAGSIVDYEDGISSIPADLRRTVGTDADGPCWYWTTQETSWVVLGIDANGQPVFGYDSDDTPGGALAVDVVLPACDGEPTDGGDPIDDAYRLLAQYDHPAPDPLLDPPVGRGVAGMATYLSLTGPEPWQASLTSPLTGLTITVQTRVDALEVDWGDGTTVVIPAEEFDSLTGYPDGAFPHTYQLKTCDSPGEPRCHPTLAAYPISLTYHWASEWRIDTQPWQPLPTPPTVTDVDYPVTEIISVITDTG